MSDKNWICDCLQFQRWLEFGFRGCRMFINLWNVRRIFGENLQKENQRVNLSWWICLYRSRRCDIILLREVAGSDKNGKRPQGRFHYVAESWLCIQRTDDEWKSPYWLSRKEGRRVDEGISAVITAMRTAGYSEEQIQEVVKSIPE